MSATVGTERYVAFQDQLVDAGVLIRSTVKGLYGKARPFVEVFDGLDRMVTLAGAKDGAELFRFPPMLPRDHFVRTDYLRSFPDLIGSIHSFCGGDAEHADFLRRVDGGEDWSESLDPTELVEILLGNEVTKQELSIQSRIRFPNDLILSLEFKMINKI